MIPQSFVNGTERTILAENYQEKLSNYWDNKFETIQKEKSDSLIKIEEKGQKLHQLNNILEKYPNDTISSKLKAILLYDQNKFDESLNILNNILNNNPNDYLALQ